MYVYTYRKKIDLQRLKSAKVLLIERRSPGAP
jgi:hypothetical protein